MIHTQRIGGLYHWRLGDVVGGSVYVPRNGTAQRHKLARATAWIVAMALATAYAVQPPHMGRTGVAGTGCIGYASDAVVYAAEESDLPACLTIVGY